MGAQLRPTALSASAGTEASAAGRLPRTDWSALLGASCSALSGGAAALLRVAPVGMPEVLSRGEPVSDELLEFLQLGEASALLARPQ